MAENTNMLNTRIQLRHDTAAAWKAATTARLLPGEIGVETDTGLFKIGKSAIVEGNEVGELWSALEYANAAEKTTFVDDESKLPTTGNNVGDVCIVKKLIEGTTAKYSYTAYVWQETAEGGDWTAMDGNYTADNVYFSEDLSTTYAMGNISLTDGSAIVSAKGRNLKQVWDSIYLKESTSVSVSSPGIDVTVSNSGTSVEVGSTFTRPTATIKVTGVGQYGNGSKTLAGASYTKAEGTGVTFNTLKVGFGASVGENTSSSVTALTSKGYVTNQTATYTASTTDIPSNIVTDGKTEYKFSGWADHTASERYPVTNLGNYITGGTLSKITATSDNPYDADGETVLAKGVINSAKLTDSATWNITGYRSFFYGWTKVNALSDLTSDDIRAMTNGGQYNASKTFEIKANGETGITYFIVAIPSDNTRSGITNVDSTAGMTVSMTDSWIKKASDLGEGKSLPTVNVADAQVDGDGKSKGLNKATYKICYWTSASIDPATVHKVTLG